LSGKVYDLLVVDDQSGVRRLLYEAFSDDGLQVALAAGGREAVQLVESSRVSLVLLDMKMPGMSGLEVLQEIRRIAPSLPVIMMTAYGELDVVAEAKKMGVRHYVTKPFDLQEVRYLVRALLAEAPAHSGYVAEIG